jgi:hypothetical protein
MKKSFGHDAKIYLKPLPNEKKDSHAEKKLLPFAFSRNFTLSHPSLEA